MKQRIYVVSFFIIVLLFVGAALYIVSKEIDSPINKDLDINVQRLIEKDYEIEGFTVGSSLNEAIDFKSLNIDGLHLWVGGSDVYEVCYLLECLLPVIDHEKIVLFPISPVNMYKINDDSFKNRSRRIIYYYSAPTLKSYIPIKKDISNMIFGKLAPLIRQDHWKEIFYISWMGRSEDNQEKRVKIRKRSFKKYTPEKDKNGNYYTNTFKRHIIMLEDKEFSVYKSKKISKKNMNLFKKMESRKVGIYKRLESFFRFLQDYNHIRMILYVPPHSDLYSKELMKYDPNEKASFREQISNLCEEYGVEYYDFFDDPDFIHDYGLFRNDIHLNAWGASAFSRKFGTIIHASKAELR